MRKFIVLVALAFLAIRPSIPVWGQVSTDEATQRLQAKQQAKLQASTQPDVPPVTTQPSLPERITLESLRKQVIELQQEVYALRADNAALRKALTDANAKDPTVKQANELPANAGNAPAKPVAKPMTVKQIQEHAVGSNFDDFCKQLADRSPRNFSLDPIAANETMLPGRTVDFIFEEQTDNLKTYVVTFYGDEVRGPLVWTMDVTVNISDNNKIVSVGGMRRGFH